MGLKMIHSLRVFPFVFFCCVSLAYGQKVSLSFDLRPGELLSSFERDVFLLLPEQNELEQRFSLDDILEASSVTRINFPWNRSDQKIFLIPGVQYAFKQGTGEWSFGLRCDCRYLLTPAAQYEYFGGLAADNFSYTKLSEYRTAQLSFQTLYSNEAIPKRLRVSAFMNVNLQVQEFNYTEYSAGAITTIAFSSPFRSWGSGFSPGVGMEMLLSKKASLAFDFTLASPDLPNLKGRLDSERIVVGSDSAGVHLRYDHNQAEYAVNLSRWSLEWRYRYTPNLKFRFGFFEEAAVVSYPNHTNIPLRVSGGALVTSAIVEEMLTDAIVYSASQAAVNAFVFLGVTYDFDFSPAKAIIEGSEP